MKKIFFLITVFCIFFSANAQDTQQGRKCGSGTDGSLYVEYYNHGAGQDGHGIGHLKFTNSSGSKISCRHIKVSVHVTGKGNDKILILCDHDFENIEEGVSIRTHSGKEEVKGGPERYGKTYEYKVEVSPCQIRDK